MRCSAGTYGYNTQAYAKTWLNCRENKLVNKLLETKQLHITFNDSQLNN